VLAKPLQILFINLSRQVKRSPGSFESKEKELGSSLFQNHHLAFATLPKSSIHGPFQACFYRAQTKGMVGLVALGYLGWGAFRNWFNNFATSMSLASANFDGREGARESFKLLKKETKPNYIDSPAGMVHQSDFWDTVAKTVDVVVADIEKLEYHKIIFTDGSSIDADALMLGTGYEEMVPFFSDADCIALGLPHKKSAEPAEVAREWETLEAAAEEEVFNRYSVLKTDTPVPKHFGDINTQLAPYCLYHGVGPLNGDPTIAFVGFTIHTNMFESSETISLWALAYLDGCIKLPKPEEM
jgi:hypothetical protein